MPGLNEKVPNDLTLVVIDEAKSERPCVNQKSRDENYRERKILRARQTIDPARSANDVLVCHAEPILPRPRDQGKLREASLEASQNHGE